jgi:hypothetical protein
MTGPRYKYPISNAELDDAGISRRLYNERRSKDWTHAEALEPARISSNNADGVGLVGYHVVYAIADHIRIRQLSRNGVSLSVLQREFKHIKPEHVEDIVNGFNYIPSNT